MLPIMDDFSAKIFGETRPGGLRHALWRAQLGTIYQGDGDLQSSLLIAQVKYKK